MNPSVTLKEGREKSLLKKHPWIFSGALESPPSCSPGSILAVYSSQGTFLAEAYFHPSLSLCGRILSFEPISDIASFLRDRLTKAYALRSLLFDLTQTNSYRLVNAEADFLPGLIVDRYGDYLAVQFHTQGIEQLRSQILEILVSLLNPKGIYERSHSSSRKEEGLTPREELCYGEVPPYIEILENGLCFSISLAEGQKTGFFLDQRAMREKVQSLSNGRRVLNCFAYSGAFSIYALKGGALSALNVDVCQRACALSKTNALLNGVTTDTICEDVFDFLAEDPLDFDFVILDPPAFAKKREHVKKALEAYERLNFFTLSKLPKGSFLMTSSCSYHVSQESFQYALFQAALKAKRSVRILSHQIQAADHPVSLYHPEGQYLKSLLLFVE